MKFSVQLYDSGYQVVENDAGDPIVVALFPKDDTTQTGAKSEAQLRAEEYCDYLNQKEVEGDLFGE